MFNPDNCGLRLIPDNELHKWLRNIQDKVDNNTYKMLVLESNKLYECSCSPTEEQFLQCIGGEEIELED